MAIQYSLLAIDLPLVNTTYNFLTTTITTILLAYGKQYQFLYDNQKGFRVERSTSKQLQFFIVASKNAKFTDQDIYLLYIDFKNAL